MSDLLKSMMNFSWVMSLFGMRQMGNLLSCPDAAAKSFDSLTEAAQSELSHSMGAVPKTENNAQRVMADVMFSLNMDGQPLQDTFVPTFPSSMKCDRRQMEIRASAGPEEKTIVRVSLGTGTVRHGVDGQAYFIVHGQLIGIDGVPDGEFEGVWAATVFTPRDLVSYPNPPTPPFDRPLRPDEVCWNPQLNPTKARWTFGHNRGWLEAVGPALSRIQIQSDGHTQFWYSVAALITGGGGVYDGVRGQATSMGSACFMTVPQPMEGVSFELNAVHVLKVVSCR